MQIQINGNIKAWKASVLVEKCDLKIEDARKLKLGEKVKFKNAGDAFKLIDFCKAHGIEHETWQDQAPKKKAEVTDG